MVAGVWKEEKGGMKRRVKRPVNTLAASSEELQDSEANPSIVAGVPLPGCLFLGASSWVRVSAVE